MKRDGLAAAVGAVLLALQSEGLVLEHGSSFCGIVRIPCRLQTSTGCRKSYAAPSSLQQVERIRGGARSSTQLVSLLSSLGIQETRVHAVSKQQNDSKGAAATLVVAVLAASLGLWSNQAWLRHHWLLISGRLRSGLLETLERVSSLGALGMVLYMGILMIVEACGMPTTPVETSAGMVFHPVSRALMLSMTAKHLGAFSCILTLRYTGLLKRLMQSPNPKQKKLSELLHLVNLSAKRHPLRVATLLRFAPFPELFKHMLLALMDESLPPLTILAAIIIHGTPFSFLWSLAGNEAHLKLLNPNFVGSPFVHYGVLSGIFLGMVVVPIFFGFWLNQLRQLNIETMPLDERDIIKKMNS